MAADIAQWPTTENPSEPPRREALDALFERLEGADKPSSIIVRDFHPDEFFTAEQRYRIDFLMRKLDRATNAGTEFTAADMAELENLIEAELDAAVRRAESISKPIG